MILSPLMKPYNSVPLKYINRTNREIADFTTENVDENIDIEVVKSFGDEWNKFNNFSKSTLEKICFEYFDIVTNNHVDENTYMIDIGCGTARWSNYFLDKAGFIEAVDPSDAIIAADKLIGDSNNIRLTKASVDTLPWPDETFDFGMSIGVLHHIPDTKQALIECVKKIKKGGYFYVYLYYNLDNRGLVFKTIFQLSDFLRRFVCKLPQNLKRIVCDIIAITVYAPFVLFSKVLFKLGLNEIAHKIPLSAYSDKDFYIIRNDSLDRFGTKLEQRFTKNEIEIMMKEAGLINIIFGEKSAYWHCIGQKSL